MYKKDVKVTKKEIFFIFNHFNNLKPIVFLINLKIVC